MNRHRLLPCFALLPALLQAAPRTQAPDAAWITFTTAHYRIHCPRAFEAFGQEVAGRAEGIHAQYLGLIGFAYEQPMDIVILDPVMEANGMAFPILQRPHVVLWKTEPEPDSAIGHHHGWAELLVTHELAHMHHLLRPARKPSLWRRWTAALGPLTEKSPRWVIEGYATLIEGKLTGSGRPHSAIRASVLRQWALEGKLPTYEALSGMDGFLGGSMAYLGGSAYLEWLEAKAGDPKVFQTLWVRLAGKRDFEASFRATFGFGPRDGYQRFCAELTHTALELERRSKAEGLRQGEVVAQLGGWATDLALSPDGTKLLARVLDPKKPGLYVWDLTTPRRPRPPRRIPTNRKTTPRWCPCSPPTAAWGASMARCPGSRSGPRPRPSPTSCACRIPKAYYDRRAASGAWEGSPPPSPRTPPGPARPGRKWTASGTWWMRPAGRSPAPWPRPGIPPPRPTASGSTTPSSAPRACRSAGSTPRSRPWRRGPCPPIPHPS
ncbi:MAG: hypothetical protein IPO28_13850 [Holophagaceae bacterium]|nr:hypothetical protein [Holophagaceae bacterium]